MPASIAARQTRGALRKKIRKPYGNLPPHLAMVEGYMEATALMSDCEHKLIRWRRINQAACCHRFVAIDMHDKGRISKEARDARVKRCDEIERETQIEMLALERRLRPCIAECKRLAGLAERAA